MHTHAKWAVENTTVVHSDSIDHTRAILQHATNIFIYIDGSVPSTDRADQGPAFALIILFEDHNGQIFILGHIAAQLRHCGTLFDLPVDSTLQN